MLLTNSNDSKPVPLQQGVFEMNDELRDLLSKVELEVRCDVCDGRGGESHCRSDWSNCPECHGSGVMPTEAGRKVLSLVQHHLFALLEKERSQ